MNSLHRERRPLDAYPVPLVGFAAYSGTGKTTLLLQVLPLLSAAGLRVAAVKHAHHGFEPDQPGKDSFLLRKAGAEQLVVASRGCMAWFAEAREEREEPSLEEALAALDAERVDLVLVEGFKHEPFPKIELYRAAVGKPLMYPADDSIVAIATDGSLPTADRPSIPHLPIDDPAAVAGFILERFLPAAPSAHQGGGA